MMVSRIYPGYLALFVMLVAISCPLLAKKKNPPPEQAKSSVITLPEKVVSVVSGDFIFRNLTLKPDNLFPEWLKLNGSVVNSTPRTWTKAYFYFELLDESGNAIERTKTQLIFMNIKPGEQRELPGYKGETIQLPDRLPPVSGFSIRFSAGVNDVHYRLRMKSPSASDALEFDDPTIRTVFAIGDKGIQMELSNKTGDPIRIDWNQCSFVDPFGTSHTVTHSGVKYTDAANAKPPTLVPPKANITDSIVPADNVHFESGEYGGWRIDDILTMMPAADKLKGRTFSLFMPLETNGKVTNYMFSFEIIDVVFR